MQARAWVDQGSEGDGTGRLRGRICIRQVEMGHIRERRRGICVYGFRERVPHL